jgi:CheY-like chemotaxis protein
MAPLSLVVALSVPLGLVACSTRNAPDPAALEAAASSRIEAIPAADPAKVRDVHIAKSWRNPYLIVKPDGVALLDISNNEEHIMNPDELAQKLAKLPDSAWPYGRVVAVTEVTASNSDQDKAQIRKNKAIVAGTLEGLHVAINWIPSV